MAKRNFYKPSKRRLTENEIKQVNEWMANAPQGRKPSIRQIARAFGRTRPTIIKSLGGWEGIQRRRPEIPLEPLIPKAELGLGQPITIEPYTIEIPELKGMKEK